MSLQVWHRPWALLDHTGACWSLIRSGQDITIHLKAGVTWLYTDDPRGPLIDGRPGNCALEARLPDGHGPYSLPIPTRRNVLAATAGGAGVVRLDSSALPERPPEDLDPADEQQTRAKALLTRVKSTWARLREVESVLADPARIWVRLGELWYCESAAANPEMDMIVRQARRMLRTIEFLDRAPRRMLRRTRQLIPLSRVQEVDRKTLAWLIRQPGETIAERAGDRQRIQAVAREENFNTLENRVLLSYARIAREVAREYRDRHVGATGSARVRLVQGFGLRCGRLERDLRERGVHAAAADVTPNFVLQNNTDYRAVWVAWHELLQRERVLDRLWRWQARSWEEFCALAVVVALQALPGARQLAVSPLLYRDEQHQGCWIRHFNPLAVLFLPEAGATVEVSYRFRAGAVLSRFGAPIWLRIGQIDSADFLSRWAIWPLWHPDGGLEPGEPDELARLLPAGRQENVRGGVTLRPVVPNGQAEQDTRTNTASFTLGTSGPALRDGLTRLGRFLHAHLLPRVG